MLKYLSFHNSSFALRYLFNAKWQGCSVTHPLFVCFIVVSLVMLLVLLESLQSIRVHPIDFIMFQPIVEKLLNRYWKKMLSHSAAPYANQENQYSITSTVQ
jgi:hypothetical protein